MARAKGTVAVREGAETDSGVTAAASTVSLDGTTWRSWRLGDTRWQMEAWRHFDICGELRFATNWMANAVSRCRLYIAELDKYGRPGKETSDESIQLLAETMFGGPALKAEAQRALGAQLYVTGESFIIAEDVAQSSKDVWYVCSSSEVHRNGTNRILVDRSNMYGGGQHEMRKGRDLMMRVWTPHPRRYDASDSSVRAVLPILREIEGLTKKVFAQIDSRLAGAGMLFLPQELDFPRTDKDPPGAKGLMSLLQRNIAASLQDQSAASALVPLMAQVPGELIDKIKWLTFETPFQAETGEKLLQAIRRLATGLDIPPEVLLGQGDTNHWSAWQIEESTIKIQIEPLLVRICDALTNGYLKAALKIIGKDPEQFVVWYDTAALAVRPNRQADAIELFRLAPTVLSAEEVRKAGDWGEGAKPGKKEYEQRLAEQVIALNPALIANADVQKALGISWKIEDPNAAPPPGEAPPDSGAPADQQPQDGWMQDTGQESDQRGLPQFPNGGTPAQEAGLLVGADHIVRRALERAGARMLTRARKSSGAFANIPAAQVYEHVDDLTPESIGQLLGDAFIPAAELADRVGMDPDVVTDMITVYTTSLMAQREPHDYARFALYVDQALELIGHGGCEQFCRNPLHPGPCKGWRTNNPPTRDSGRSEPVAGPGTPRKRAPAAKKAAKKAAPAISTQKGIADQVRDAQRAVAAESPRDAKVVTRGAAVKRDLEDAAAGDSAAQARVTQAAHEAYSFTDPDTGITAKVVEVVPDTSGPGAGVRIRVRMLDEDGQSVGVSTRTWRIPLGKDKIRVRHHTLEMAPGEQGGGFSRRWNAQAIQGYHDMGVDKVTVSANDSVGGAAWAGQGFDFQYEEEMLQIADRFRAVADRMDDGDPIKAELNRLIVRSTHHDFEEGTHPSPYEWYMAGQSEPMAPRRIRGSARLIPNWLGKNVMLGTAWEGFYSITDPHRPSSRPGGVTSAADVPQEDGPEIPLTPEQEASWDERGEFMDAIHQLDLVWANAIAEDVPSDPEYPGRPGKINDYPEHHHLFSADEVQTDAYLQLQEELMAKWGRDDEGAPGEEIAPGEEQDAVVAHAGCLESEFCRAPLHPGPCRGWRQRERAKKPERARAREDAERARRQRGATPAPRKATPAKATPAKKAAKKAAPAAPAGPTPEEIQAAETQRRANEIAAETARNRDLLAQAPQPPITGMDRAHFEGLVRAVQGDDPYRTGRYIEPAPGARARATAAQQELEQLARNIYEINDGPSGLRTKVRSVGVTGGGRIGVTLNIYDANGNTVGTSERVLGKGATGHGSGMQAYHAYLQLQSSVQGGGFAERYNARAYQAYAELGVSHVGVHANIDVGGYTWATQGFDWESEDDMNTMASRFRSWIRGGWPAPPGSQNFIRGADLEEINDLLARSTPQAYRDGTAPSPYEWAMAGRARPQRVPGDARVRARWLEASPQERARIEAQPGTKMVEVWAGKLIMLGSSWHGSRPITRPVRPGGPVAFRGGQPAGAQAPRRTRRPRTTAGLTAATAEMDVFSERMEFLLAIAEQSLAYANTVAQDVPAVPEDANPNSDGQTDYAANHHLISADEAQTLAFLDLAEDLLMEWGRDGADVAVTASAHSNCTETFCRAPLHPGPCKQWRVPLRTGPRDTGEPDLPGTSAPRPMRIRGHSGSGSHNNFSHALTRDTGPDGIAVEDFTVYEAGAGPYVIPHGTLFRIDGTSYLVDHDPTPEGKRKARAKLEQVQRFHDKWVRDQDGSHFTQGYFIAARDRPLTPEQRQALAERGVGAPGDRVFATAGNGIISVWGTDIYGLPTQDVMDNYLLHEHGHNVARVRDEPRIDYAQPWLDSVVADSAGGGPASRVSDFTIDVRSLMGMQINGSGHVDGRPFPGGVTQYGTSNPAEDFAEAHMLYRLGPLGDGRIAGQRGIQRVYFRDLFPARAAQLDAQYPVFAQEQLARISSQRGRQG